MWSIDDSDEALKLNKLVHWCRNNSNSLIFVTLLLGSGIFSHLLTNEYSLDGGRKQIALPAKLLLACSYGLSVGMLVVYWNELKTKTTSITWVWIVLMLWTVVSLVIGQFNIQTVIRLVGFYGCTLIGIMLFVCTRSLRDVLGHIFAVSLIIALVNILYLDMSVLTNVNAKFVKGVFVQKNLLGHFSVMAMFVSVYIFFTEDNVIYRGLSLLGFTGSAWLLLLSTSMTSNLMLLIALLSSIASLVISRYQKGWLLVSMISVVGVLFLALNWSEIFELIGKNTTFTGRTTHWIEYWILIEQSFIAGHGYGAYPYDVEQTYWITAGPHSGYVELLYYIGFVGALFMTIIASMAVVHWWNLVNDKKLVLESTFFAGFLAMFLALNFVETYMLNRSGLYWPLFVYVSLQLAFLNNKRHIEKENR